MPRQSFARAILAAADVVPIHETKANEGGAKEKTMTNDRDMSERGSQEGSCMSFGIRGGRVYVAIVDFEDPEVPVTPEAVIAALALMGLTIYTDGIPPQKNCWCRE
jgi:hypothetical protein